MKDHEIRRRFQWKLGLLTIALALLFGLSVWLCLSDDNPNRFLASLLAFLSTLAAAFVQVPDGYKARLLWFGVYQGVDLPSGMYLTPTLDVLSILKKFRIHLGYEAGKLIRVA